MSKIVNLEESKNKKKLHKIIVYIIFILIIMYIFYAIYLLLKSSTDTYMVESGTVTLEESATGYIIRDEIVVKGNNYQNGIYPIVSEGEKTAKNQTVFRYYGSNEEEIKQNITSTDKKIQEALESQNTIFPTDAKNIEKQIDEKLYGLNTQTDLQKINEYKKEISELVTKKAKIVGNLSPSGSYIQELTKKREELENDLLKSSEYMVAPKSGVISYRVDNLENVLTIDDFSKLNEETLNNLELKTGKIISASSECAKIIDNSKCYIATLLNSNVASEAEKGKKVKLTLASGNEIQAQIDTILPQENGNILIILKLDTLNEELISYRKISFNITWWSSSGLKVQNSSIVEDENGLKYVVRKKSGYYTKLLVKVLKKNDKYSIISIYNNNELLDLKIDTSNYTKLSIYDTILTYPDLNKLKLSN